MFDIHIVSINVQGEGLDAARRRSSCVHLFIVIETVLTVSVAFFAYHLSSPHNPYDSQSYDLASAQLSSLGLPDKGDTP